MCYYQTLGEENNHYKARITTRYDREEVEKRKKKKKQE